MIGQTGRRHLGNREWPLLRSRVWADVVCVEQKPLLSSPGDLWRVYFGGKPKTTSRIVQHWMLLTITGTVGVALCDTWTYFQEAIVNPHTTVCLLLHQRVCLMLLSLELRLPVKHNTFASDVSCLLNTWIIRARRVWRCVVFIESTCDFL